MKWSDVISKILGKSMDDEIDDASLQALGLNKDVNLENKDKQNSGGSSTININLSGVDKDKTPDNNSTEGKKEEDEDMDYKTIKFDVNSGKFDLSNIENADLKAVLQLANDTVDSTANKYKIDTAFNEKLAGLKIRKGITADAVKTLIKMDNVKVEGDKVVGLDEAFETLQKEQSGLFVQRNTSESTPVLEGYHPAGNDGSGNNIDNALAQLASEVTAVNN